MVYERIRLVKHGVYGRDVVFGQDAVSSDRGHQQTAGEQLQQAFPGGFVFFTQTAGGGFRPLRYLSS
jgi:hypothetical protein